MQVTIEVILAEFVITADPGAVKQRERTFDSLGGKLCKFIRFLLVICILCCETGTMDGTTFT
jgi:hypothetical protein